MCNKFQLNCMTPFDIALVCHDSTSDVYSHEEFKARTAAGKCGARGMAGHAYKFDGVKICPNKGKSAICLLGRVLTLSTLQAWPATPQAPHLPAAVHALNSSSGVTIQDSFHTDIQAFEHSL